MKRGMQRKRNGLVSTIIVAAMVLFGLLFMTAMSGNRTAQSVQSYASSGPKDLQAMYDKIPTQSGKINFLRQSHNLTQNVDPELVDLDNQIITCSPNVDGLLSSHPHTGASCVGGDSRLRTTKGMYLSGQCCGTLMGTKQLHENRAKLQAYQQMPNMVLNPYKTPIMLAKYWIDYDHATTLTPVEQKIFDEAYRVSQEKPCCCKCWHYFVGEGIAKKMIHDQTFNARQIADFWDASTICGV